MKVSCAWPGIVEGWGRSGGEGQESAVSGQGSAVSGQRSAVSGRGSGVRGQSDRSLPAAAALWGKRLEDAPPEKT